MNKKYDFELRLTRKEYAALMDIRGLDARAHMMVICAKLHEGGDWTLQGSHEDFDALLRDLDEEIEERLAPKKNIPALARIREYITPAEDEDEDEDGYTISP